MQNRIKSIEKKINALRNDAYKTFLLTQLKFLKEINDVLVCPILQENFNDQENKPIALPSGNVCGQVYIKTNKEMPLRDPYDAELSFDNLDQAIGSTHRLMLDVLSFLEKKLTILENPIKDAEEKNKKLIQKNDSIEKELTEKLAHLRTLIEKSSKEMEISKARQEIEIRSKQEKIKNLETRPNLDLTEHQQRIEALGNLKKEKIRFLNGEEVRLNQENNALQQEAADLNKKILEKKSELAALQAKKKLSMQPSQFSFLSSLKFSIESIGEDILSAGLASFLLEILEKLNSSHDLDFSSRVDLIPEFDPKKLIVIFSYLAIYNAISRGMLVSRHYLGLEFKLALVIGLTLGIGLGVLLGVNNLSLAFMVLAGFYFSCLSPGEQQAKERNLNLEYLSFGINCILVHIVVELISPVKFFPLPSSRNMAIAFGHTYFLGAKPFTMFSLKNARQQQEFEAESETLATLTNEVTENKRPVRHYGGKRRR